ncbi:MAG TPA: hypothetical protein VFT65_00570, partial [Candidatus Angelobacter sp.]|nr:hypothetical protein [Candidatus Angelobacter sp.]
MTEFLFAISREASIDNTFRERAGFSCPHFETQSNSRASINVSQKNLKQEARMTITFADGAQIEVAATALDDFLRHDLKWAEFVHGRASTS